MTWNVVQTDFFSAPIIQILFSSVMVYCELLWFNKSKRLNSNRLKKHLNYVPNKIPLKLNIVIEYSQLDSKS